MRRVLGIDYSSRSVDLVYLDETTDAARWHSIPLPLGVVAGARAVREEYAWSANLEEVYLIAIEDAYSAGRVTAKGLGRVCGAILASLPSTFPREHVWIMRPDEWKLTCGLSGKARKLQVAEWARERFAAIDGIELWSQDALDALCIAYAAREINAKAVAARVARRRGVARAHARRLEAHSARG